ncbi:vitelline membrane protein Vm26Aa-like [Anastrepha ludens]|uniref:vitelline membrane protein Vm26Aa-like n=1 Tax=Anastrepha ludens TaxID=28586 RepID=UPI0023AEBC3F|nr:vitelline membrane protein Vm26Aa-like [Anastrepha ludens]
MKSFVCITLFAVIFSVALAAPAAKSASDSAAQEVESAQNLQAVYDLSRVRKSAYGGGAVRATFPAPACPKNYLFSCQPSLAPVACASPGGSIGPVAAYSAPIPTYVAPLPADLSAVGYNPTQYYFEQ